MGTRQLTLVSENDEKLLAVQLALLVGEHTLAFGGVPRAVAKMNSFMNRPLPIWPERIDCGGGGWWQLDDRVHDLFTLQSVATYQFHREPQSSEISGNDEYGSDS